MDKQALTINVNVQQCLNWKTLLLVGVAFCIGSLCGRISMANSIEEENNGKHEKN